MNRRPLESGLPHQAAILSDEKFGRVNRTATPTTETLGIWSLWVEEVAAAKSIMRRLLLRTVINGQLSSARDSPRGAVFDRPIS